MNKIEMRKAVCRDVIAQLNAKKYVPSSTYFRISSEVGKYGFEYSDEGYKFKNHIEELNSGKREKCFVCQRGAMAVSMLNLGLDGEPEDADLNEGFMGVLSGMMDPKQIRTVEAVYEGEIYSQIVRAMGVDPMIEHAEDRMRQICNRIIEHDEGLLVMTDDEVRQAARNVVEAGYRYPRDFDMALEMLAPTNGIQIFNKEFDKFFAKS